MALPRPLCEELSQWLMISLNLVQSNIPANREQPITPVKKDVQTSTVT